ncbi:MAG TPA: hypothetical protein VFB72_17375 [Verrucomicrobiae bacterium]|nr:hypothetical protein [Verrucomicrobiae bacterium]
MRGSSAKSFINQRDVCNDQIRWRKVFPFLLLLFFDHLKKNSFLFQISGTTRYKAVQRGKKPNCKAAQCDKMMRADAANSGKREPKRQKRLNNVRSKPP